MTRIRAAAWDEPGDDDLGRSRGGLSTKIHAAVDGRGRLLVIPLTAALLWINDLSGVVAGVLGVEHAFGELLVPRLHP
jgi:hypothetical protein